MHDDYYKEKVIEHDKHLDTLAVSLNGLTKSVESTYTKLDDILAVISQQNVLMEKFTSLEQETRTSVKTINSDIRAMHEVQDNRGCPMLRVETGRLDVIVKTVDAMDEEIKAIDGKVLPASVIKWVFLLLIGYSITFGVYVTQTLGALEKEDVGVIRDIRGLKDDVSKFGENQFKKYTTIHSIKDPINNE